ncbi:hypothetical protein CDAR_249091 [Caerostris darwini]|uniref:Secreted protein n=1 Tax=Caerostris darwini TaxID=1538125 RepID=A0AAV4RSY4_9ARAC|nr:hypothetical protein CDAR_249091 [Caerostris darwini]
MFQHGFLFFFFFFYLPLCGIAPLTPEKSTAIRAEVDIRSGCFSSSRKHAGRREVFNKYKSNCQRKCCSSHGQSLFPSPILALSLRHQFTCMQTSKKDF